MSDGTLRETGGRVAAPRGNRKVQMTLRVNGEEQDVSFLPNGTLLEVLREDMALTGTKEYSVLLPVSAKGGASTLTRSSFGRAPLVIARIAAWRSACVAEATRAFNSAGAASALAAAPATKRRRVLRGSTDRLFFIARNDSRKTANP